MNHFVIEHRTGNRLAYLFHTFNFNDMINIKQIQILSLLVNYDAYVKFKEFANICKHFTSRIAPAEGLVEFGMLANGL